jgi:hypothetical protein
MSNVTDVEEKVKIEIETKFSAKELPEFKTQKEKTEYALLEIQDIRLEISKLSAVVNSLLKSVKQLEKDQGLEATDLGKIIEDVELLTQTLEIMRLAHEACAERQSEENKWKNRRVVSLLDRITLVVGAIIALIATFFAGKGFLK